MTIDLRSHVQKWDGRKISKPGIYSDLPIDIYHGDCTDGPAVSSSILRTVEAQSPLHAWRDYYGNPNRREQETKAHFTLGKAIHHLAGGEAMFGEHFIVRPAKWDSWRTNEAKAWRAEQQALGFDILEPKDLDVIRGVADSLQSHPTIQAGILRGLVEHSVIYRDAETGLWVKTRPDVLPLDSSMIVDLKSTATADRASCIKSLGQFGYHIQMAMIDEALWQVAALEASDHVLVNIEKSDPWAVNIKPLAFEAIDFGRRQFRRALDTFAGCLKSGVWPGYPDDLEQVGLPAWLTAKLKAEAENGMLPDIDGRQPREATVAAMADDEEAVG